MNISIPNKNYNSLLFILNDQHTMCRIEVRSTVGKSGDHMCLLCRSLETLVESNVRICKTDCTIAINKNL